MNAAFACARAAWKVADRAGRARRLFLRAAPLVVLGYEVTLDPRFDSGIELADVLIIYRHVLLFHLGHQHFRRRWRRRRLLAAASYENGPGDCEPEHQPRPESRSSISRCCFHSYSPC